MRRPWIVLALATALGSCSDDAPPRSMPGEGLSRVAERELEPAAPAPEIPADAPLVAFLGDSIAAGLHLAADQAFPAVLQRELALQGLPFRLINAGVSGDTSAGGLRRVEWVLSREPDVVVVELGGNDGLRGQDVAGVEQNLRAIVSKARESGARVLLLGVQLPPNLGREYVEAFEALYPRVAAAEGVALVPEFMGGVGGVSRMNLEDGLHPTADGHRRLAENVAPALRELLATAAQR